VKLLQGADLRGAYIMGENFGSSNLQGANLTGAHIYDVFASSLQNLDLTQTRLISGSAYDNIVENDSTDSN